MYWPQQHIQSKAYFTEDYVAMLSEDADKLFEKLVKKLEDEIRSDYPAKGSSPSLPLLPSSDEDFPTNQKLENELRRIQHSNIEASGGWRWLVHHCMKRKNHAQIYELLHNRCSSIPPLSQGSRR
jgi:hypothetical protein